MSRPSTAALLLLGLVAWLPACGNSDRPGVGYVTVQGLANGQSTICGQPGGGGQGGTFNILGSGFLSEHGSDVTVVFTAVTGTPFEGGTAATTEVPAQVISDSMIVSQFPAFTGTVTVTLTVILPGGNRGVSVPGEVTIGGTLGGPYAFSDFYTTPQETDLVVPAAQGPLVNDFGRQCIPDRGEPGPQNSPPSVTGFTITSYEAITTNGGSVVMGPDGAFTYSPPDGFTGLDSFEYTMDDRGFPSTATVFITVSDV